MNEVTRYYSGIYENMVVFYTQVLPNLFLVRANDIIETVFYGGSLSEK